MALQAGKLDRRARIEQKIVTRDDYLAEVVSWQEVTTVWAGKRDLSGREYFAAAATQSAVDCEITIRWRAGLRTDMRLLLDGAVYDIHAVTEIGRREGLLLRCSRAGDAEIILLLSGTAAGSGGLSGTLPIEALLLSGAADGAGDLAGSLAAAVRLLSGLAQGSSALTGALQQAGALLAGTASGVAVLSGQVAVKRLLAGTATGQGDAGGPLVVMQLLGGGIVTAGSLIGSLAAAGTLWTPALQSDLALWLDAADSGTLTLDAGAVSAWADKSGNARHVGEVTASRRPSYQPAGWPGGMPCIDWGTAANVKRLFYDPGVAGDDYRVNFVVAVWDDPGGTFPTYNALFGGYAQAGLNSGVCLAGTSGGTGWFTGGAGAWHAGQTFHNGAAVASLTAQPLIQSPFIVRADSAAATNAQGVCIGNNRNYIVNNYGWRGRVAEVVSVSAAISLADKQRIEGYLAHKWGIALEAGHPYESAPPII
jgi:SPP1 family predicted phage head-tail adaptor